MTKLEYGGPVVLCVLDGVGLRDEETGNALKQAHLEFLTHAIKNYPTAKLLASGEAVGILPDDMGNSEVGHIALGSGQIVKQGIAHIEDQFNSGAIWQSDAWREAIANVLLNNSTLHFSGIFSDGNVHSSINHLARMIAAANKEGVKKIRVHLVFDGRDVPPQSEPLYINALEKFFTRFPDADYKIASGGGRMVFVADRYESDWNVVKTGWDAIVWGKAPRTFHSATEAIETLRAEDPTVQDQYLPPFVITDQDGHPVGPVLEHDSFIYYDFRADRAIEIAQAFTYDDFPYFDRGTENNRRLEVFFAGMTEYNSDTHVPAHQLVPPVAITNTLHDFLGEKGISQFAISETVKFGHITYYFNGNSYEKAPLEEHVEIPSDTMPFNTRPWMKSAETTDALLDALPNFRFLRINYPGGDMVGHFGEMESTITALEAIDIQLARIAKKVDELGGIMLITADHGNAEELVDEAGQPKTSHSKNLVPCVFYDNTANREHYHLQLPKDAGLSNVASTISLLLGQDDYPSAWRTPLIGLS